MRTMGTKMTKLSNSRGLCIELASSCVVLVASAYGIPVSTTQVQLSTGRPILDKRRGPWHPRGTRPLDCSCGRHSISCRPSGLRLESRVDEWECGRGFGPVIHGGPGVISEESGGWGGRGQIATGGIMAVGLIEGRGGLNWRLMIRIFFGWGMTIIFTAVTCGCMVAFCVNGPERMGTNRRVGLAKTLTADAELYASLLNSTRSVATADLAVPDSDMYPYPAREPRPALLPAWLRRGLNLDATFSSQQRAQFTRSLAGARPHFTDLFCPGRPAWPGTGTPPRSGYRWGSRWTRSP